MKIKYIGNFSDGTGWAKAATYNALALSRVHDVYCEERKYNSNSVILEEDLLDLLNKKGDGFDYVIQHVLPSDYVYYGNTKNWGFCMLEATLSNKIWLKNLNMMDGVFVPDKRSFDHLYNSGFNRPAKLFPLSFNYERIANSPDSLRLAQLKGSYNFVFVGEFCRRKNLSQLLQAFHGEFNHKEPVNLLIKTSGDTNAIKTFVENVERGLKKNSKLKNILVVNERLSEQDLISVMRQCHCFVTASHGEAWCYPAMEAAALGLSVIYPKETGMEDYLSPYYSMDANLDYCFGAVDSVDGLYTCEDQWTTVSTKELRDTMRRAYNDYVNNRTIAGRTVNQYDYRNTNAVEGLGL